jgi:hypothetical protein
MPLYLTNLPVIANGTIMPSCFVTLDVTRDNAVIQATGSTAPIIGISQEGTLQPPNLLAALGSTAPTAQPAALAGGELKIYHFGDVCGLTAGGTLTAGDLITSDANGNGIKATGGGGAEVGAMTFSGAAAGEIVTVISLPPGIKA